MVAEDGRTLALPDNLSLQTSAATQKSMFIGVQPW